MVALNNSGWEIITVGFGILFQKPGTDSGVLFPRKGSIMLVFSRRIGEEFLIADDINIKVLAIKGNQVQVGISAPISIHVVRQELIGTPANESRSVFKTSEGVTIS